MFCTIAEGVVHKDEAGEKLRGDMNIEHRLPRDVVIDFPIFYDQAIFKMADRLKQACGLTLLLHRGHPASGRIVIVLEGMTTGRCCVNTTLPIGHGRVDFESASCIVMRNT